MRLILQRVSSASVAGRWRDRSPASGRGWWFWSVWRRVTVPSQVVEGGRQATSLENLRGCRRADESRHPGDRGILLVVSQFTLAGSLAKGRRPSFGAAARPPDEAEPLIQELVDVFVGSEYRCRQVDFAPKMQVALVNDGAGDLLLEFEPAKASSHREAASSVSAVQDLRGGLAGARGALA